MSSPFPKRSRRDAALPPLSSFDVDNSNDIQDMAAVSTSAGTAVASAVKRAVGKLTPQTSAFLLCDIQERFRPLVHKGDTVVRTAQFMTSVAKALDIPVVTTQQYTKVFGPTVPECFADPSDLQTAPVFEKKLFSMMTPNVREYISEKLESVDLVENDGVQSKRNKITSYVIFGMEAHVCVQQTALDLLEDGHDVHVIVDGVSSQRPLDREVALRRMEQAGAFLTTAQSAAFMLLRSAEHENFKTVSKLVVANMKEPNEFHNG